MIYSKDTNNPKIIRFLIVSTLILVISILISKSYNIYQVHKINQLTHNIYEHPLKVSNQALYVKTNLYKIHRTMKDIVLYPNDEELEKLIVEVNKIEKEVYQSLDVIKKYILGEEGQKLERYTRNMFRQWKPIRDNVNTLIKNKEYVKAIQITKGDGTNHVNILEKAAEDLYLYAQNKAVYFKNESVVLFDEFEMFNLFTTLIFLFLFLFTSYYVVRKLSNDINLLKENRLMLETIINDAPNPIIIFNETGKILMINKVWEELTGYSHKEIDTLEKWTKKAYGDNHIIVSTFLQTLFDKEYISDNGEYTIQTKNGSKLIWVFKSTPIGKIDNKKTVISSAMDITDLKNKDNLLHIQSKHAAMGEMLSNISHQWRQPLSMISTIATSLDIVYQEKGFDKKDFSENMKTINDTVQYLSKTIDDFRTFFIPNKEKKQFNVNKILEKAFSLVSSQFKNKNIHIIKNIDSLDIFGFENEFLQVVINILNNSRDALEKNNTIKEKYIFIDVYKKDDYITISIKDNAEGIEEEIINKIFDPYFTTKHQSQGTGIGLYMSEEIIQKHMNGEITVKNEVFNYHNKEYKGALFNIKLPLSK